MGELEASGKKVVWLREHGAVGGKGICAALDAGVAVTKVQRLAAALARERGRKAQPMPHAQWSA